MSSAIAETRRVQGPDAARYPGAVFEVLPDLAGLRLSIVNLYLWGPPGAGDRRWVLIDAGLPLAGAQIRAAAAERFGRHARPAAIVLTHGHFDHTGVVKELAADWDVPVFAHELEMPYLTGRASYPPPDPTVGGGLMSLMSPLYPRGPVDLDGRVQTLPGDGSVPHMPGWRWLPTPGHSPGHVSLFRDSDRALIAGDAFVTVKQESALDVLFFQQPSVHRPPAYFTQDWEAAGRSVKELAELRPNVAVTGHGLPMFGDRLRRELEQLAYGWQRLAVPSTGRYVGHPALFDARGPAYIPPTLIEPRTAAIGIGALALGAGFLLWRQTRTR